MYLSGKSISLLLAINLPLLFYLSSGFSETLNCIVGDEQKGHWQFVSVPPIDKCLFKGPADEGVPSTLTISKYKIVSYVTGMNSAEPIDCAEAYKDRAYNCVTDYSKWWFDEYFSKKDAYSFDGIMMTIDYSGNGSPSYRCLISMPFYLYEWQCEDTQIQRKNNNFGGPMCMMR